MIESFRFRCGNRRSVVLFDVVYPLLSGLAEGWGSFVLFQVFCPFLASLSECCVVSWVVAGNVDVCDHVLMFRMGFGVVFLLFHVTVLWCEIFALTVRE